MHVKKNGKIARDPAGPPTPITITVTKEQIAGLMERQGAVTRSTDALNAFLSGVVSGHGHSNVQVTAVDDVTRTLTLQRTPA
jgi:hypothetical protein